MATVPADEVAKVAEQSQAAVRDESASEAVLGYTSQPAPELGSPYAPVTPLVSARSDDERPAGHSPWGESSGEAPSDVVDAPVAGNSALADAEDLPAGTEAEAGAYADADAGEYTSAEIGSHGADAQTLDPSPAADAAEERGIAQEPPVDSAPVSWASEAMDELPGRGDEAWEIGTVASWDVQALGGDAAVDEAAAERAHAAPPPADTLSAGEDAVDELGSDAFAFPELPPGHDPFGPVADVFEHEPLVVGEGLVEEPVLGEATDWSWSQPQESVEGFGSDALPEPASASEPATGAVANAVTTDEAITDEAITEHVSEMAIFLPPDGPDTEPGSALLEAAAESPWPTDTPDHLEPHGDPLRAELAPEVPMHSDEDARSLAVAAEPDEPVTAPTVEPARANLADALAMLAERVRAGELQVPGYQEEQGEAAALAATLAALLNARR